MGANDVLEQLEAAKAECVRLERELAHWQSNHAHMVELKRKKDQMYDDLRAAVQQPNREVLARIITDMMPNVPLCCSGAAFKSEGHDQNPPCLTVLRGREIADAILAALPIPATGEVTDHRCEFYPHRDVMQCVCGNREVTP